MIKRGSEEYSRCLKVVDYFNQRFEKEGFVGRAFYLDGTGFFYMAYSNPDLWGMYIDLVHNFGEYDYEYESSNNLIITETIENEVIDVYTDSEAFLIATCSDYRDIK